MLKKELRLNYKHLRSELTAEAVLNKSIRILHAVKSLPIWDADNFHVFLPIKNQGEVDTAPLISFLRDRGKQILVPRITQDRYLEHYLFTESSRTELNKWNIPEPVDGLKIEPQDIDVVFVPLLAFDLSGHRVGYGKGFYDIFLSQCRTDTVKVGLSFFEAERKIDDYEETDVTLDYCVTPERIYSF